MRVFPILLGAGAAAVLGVTAFASEAHPSNHGAQVSVVAQSTTPGPGHGAAVSKVASQNRAGDSDRDEVAAKTTPKPLITPKLSTACADAMAKVKLLRAADAAEDARERAAEAAETESATGDEAEDAAERAADQAEDQAEMTDMAGAFKDARAACINAAVTRSDVCSEAREALAQFTNWEQNRNVQLSSTLTSRIQQAIAQACA